jgi:ATP-dependent helicase/nuclease subunit A
MSLTAAQQAAVAARGNVLVMAGAGTGKTSTLVARCIDCLSGSEPASLDELLVVTFTEAAAAEARERIRTALDAKLAETSDEHWARQLALFDAAHIGTLHSFCFKLIRQHFYQLGLDPQVTVLDEGQARLLAEETLTELLEEHYAGGSAESAAVRELIETYAAGRDESIRRLVLQLHHYSQTRPDPPEWFARQIAMFENPEPVQWGDWLLAGIAEWRNLWLAELESLRGDNAKAAECADILLNLPVGFDRDRAAQSIQKILAAKEGVWPKGKKTELQKPLEDFFADAEFLATLTPAATDPLTEDWNWCRPPMLALLRLTEQFTSRFTERKRADGVVDFHDLEQLALQLLWDGNPRRASAIAKHWREKLRFVFVDEYQDINAAQDQIIIALSHEDAQGNRFLVGDVKQSIYRFRLAAPAIFRAYARDWCGAAGTTIPLTENFRSRAAILEFANAVFTPLMREEIGGLKYNTEARLIPGLRPATSDRDVEILFRLSERNAARTGEDEALDDLRDAEREARHIALRLRELKSSGRQILDRETGQMRPIAWRDMAVLLRAPSGKAEGYAKQFERAGVPLWVERGGFFETLEVADLLNLLRLLDNPLQDVPLLAVLRSPLVGLSLDELATIRLAAKGHFWTALVRFSEYPDSQNATSGNDASRITHHVSSFLARFSRWRKLARHAALSKCLDTILAETHYAEWLRSQERGEQRHANVQRLLGLAEQYDQFQRQGLFRFLRFVEAQHDAGAEPEAAAASGTNSVRLMSIHQSKGLEFPVVVVADLGKAFNVRDLKAEIILDEEYGLCPQVRPPGRAARYPSAAHWLARQRQRRELLGEELRLLYVALTRAREKLILTGSTSRKKWDALAGVAQITPLTLLSSRSAADWLCLWLALYGGAADGHFTFRELDDAALVAEPERAAAAPAENLPALDDETFERLRTVLTWEYPFADATQRAAKTSVTALRRAAAEELEAEEIFVPRFRRAAKPDFSRKLSAVDIGNAHHKFLQHVALTQAGDVDGLRAEATRLQHERVLTTDEAAALDFTALEGFWRSSVGKKIRARAANVKRELPFTARFAPAELDGIVGRPNPPAGGDDFVIVQGVADLVVLLPEEIWLLDFKTDDATKSEVGAKQVFYAPQLRLYALALGRIYGQRVTESWLHFLACGETVRVTGAL